MRVYIAGPITGVENYEENFRKEERKLKEDGHTVFNPAEIGKKLEKMRAGEKISHEQYMSYLLPYLLQADAVCMIDGWENSEGARLEHDVAKATGKTFIKVKVCGRKW